MSDICGAKTRQGGKCQKSPMPNGRCHLHGGKTPKGVDSVHWKHGRYSSYLPAHLQESIGELEQYSLLDLADELQTQRLLISSYMQKWRDGDQPMQEQNLSAMIGWMDTVGKMVERIMKIRNETAMTATEIAHLQAKTLDVARKYIDDPNLVRQFIIELFEVSEPSRLA